MVKYLTAKIQIIFELCKRKYHKIDTKLKIFLQYIIIRIDFTIFSIHYAIRPSCGCKLQSCKNFFQSSKIVT